MPFSYSAQLSTIVGFAERVRPQSVLDVGIGMGQYGFLLRTNLESEHLFVIEGSSARQRPKSEWKTRIDGIEGYAGYLTPVHEYAYNDIKIGDALLLLPSIPDNSYDLVMAIDIVEHFYDEQARQFLEHLKRVSKKHVLVSTPKDFIHQEIEANPLEDHRSHWDQKDLQECGFNEFLDNPLSWIAVASKA